MTMTINPVWFGVLMTIVAEIVLFILIGILRSIFVPDDEEESVELPPEIIEELKKQIKAGNIYQVVAGIPDRDEEEHK